MGRCRRRIELPTETDVNRQLGSDQPLVLHEREKLPRAVSRKDHREISPRGAGYVEQEAGKGVREAGVRIALDRGLRRAELVTAARVDGLRLQQIVPDTTHLAAPLNRVIASRLGPRIR